MKHAGLAEEGVSRCAVRQSMVVHTTLSGHMIRVSAARDVSNGVQIITMGQLAARLAGGFLRPIDPDALRHAVRASLPVVPMGELDPIKNLPGMVRAAVSTLDKVWQAGIDLSDSKHPRLQALCALEQEVLRQLPPSMKRPMELVDLACKRLNHALATLGPVGIRGHSEMAPCWRPLLTKLTEVVPVSWMAGPRHVPNWLRNTNVEVITEAPKGARPRLYSCANQQHEVVEAFRWISSVACGGHPSGGDRDFGCEPCRP